MLRPPLVTPSAEPGWYRAVGNAEVVDWLRHVFFFGDDAHKPITVLVVTPDMVDADAFEMAGRQLIPLLFDQLSTRAGRRAMRELKAAGLFLPGRHRPAANRRLKPLLRE